MEYDGESQLETPALLKNLVPLRSPPLKSTSPEKEEAIDEPTQKMPARDSRLTGNVVELQRENSDLKKDISRLKLENQQLKARLEAAENQIEQNGVRASTSSVRKQAGGQAAFYESISPRKTNTIDLSGNDDMDIDKADPEIPQKENADIFARTMKKLHQAKTPSLSQPEEKYEKDGEVKTEKAAHKLLAKGSSIAKLERKPSKLIEPQEHVLTEEELRIREEEDRRLGSQAPVDVV